MAKVMQTVEKTYNKDTQETTVVGGGTHKLASSYVRHGPDLWDGRFLRDLLTGNDGSAARDSNDEARADERRREMGGPARSGRTVRIMRTKPCRVRTMLQYDYAGISDEDRPCGIDEWSGPVSRNKYEERSTCSWRFRGDTIQSSMN